MILLCSLVQRISTCNRIRHLQLARFYHDGDMEIPEGENIQRIRCNI